MGLKTCCCCATLKTGTSVIGWIGVIGQFLSVFYWIGALAQGSATVSEGGSYISVGIIGIIIPALLLSGVNQQKTWMFLPWLVCSVLGCIILVVFVIIFGKILITAAPAVDEKDRGRYEGWAAFIMIIFLAALAVNIYCFAVVLSYYQEVKARNASSTVQPSALLYRQEKNSPASDRYGGV